jgi:hypothetical protein
VQIPWKNIIPLFSGLTHKMEETHSSESSALTYNTCENVHVGNIYTANIHVHSSASFGKPL